MKAYKGAFFKTESGKRVSIEASPLWNGERSPKKQDRQLRHQKESSSEERCSIYTSTRVRHLLVVVPISKWNEKRARGSLAKPSKAVPDTDEIVGDSISLFRIPDYIIE